MMRGLPLFAGRWNDHFTRYFTYDVEPGPGGGVRSKVARHAIEEEVAALQRTRLWVWHHRIQAPTLLLRAPDGLLTADDCLMTQEEAEATAHGIPNCELRWSRGRTTTRSSSATTRSCSMRSAGTSALESRRKLKQVAVPHGPDGGDG